MFGIALVIMQTLRICASLGAEPLPNSEVSFHVHHVVANNIDAEILLQRDSSQVGQTGAAQSRVLRTCVRPTVAWLGPGAM